MRKLFRLGLSLAVIGAMSPILSAGAVAQGVEEVTQDTYLSEEIQEACEEIGDEYGICAEFLEAIIETESSGNPNAKNGSCKGLMQISTKWHSGRMEKLGVTDIYDIEGNIRVGADYLLELFEKYEDAATVLMVFHGESNATTKAESGEISSYANKILERSAELERVHGK